MRCRRFVFLTSSHLYCTEKSVKFCIVAVFTTGTLTKQSSISKLLERNLTSGLWMTPRISRKLKNAKIIMNLLVNNL